MKKDLIIKAMVLGTIAVSMNAAGFAADVETHAINHTANEQQFNTLDDAKREALHSTWKDRYSSGYAI